MKTIIYDGILELAKKVNGEKNDLYSHAAYRDFREQFRYPGEVLEQMENKGYGTFDDYVSAMGAVIKIWEYNMEDLPGMYNTTQISDFLVRARKIAIDNNSLFLAYQLMGYSDDDEIFWKVVEKSTLEEIFVFMRNVQTGFDSSALLDSKWEFSINYIDHMLQMKEKEIAHLSEYSVSENEPFYRMLEKECSYFLDCYGKNEIKKYPWKDFVLTFAILYTTVVKSTQEKYLRSLGFSHFDTTYLSTGIWSGEEHSEFYKKSPVRWSNAFRLWFEEYFAQEQDLSEKVILSYQNFSMPRKIDGISKKGEFLLDGMRNFTTFRGTWHHTDLLLYFYLMNREDLTYSWNDLHTGYDLSLENDDNIEKVKEFIHFCNQYESLLDDKKQGFYILLDTILEDNLSSDMKVFRERESLVEEMFSVNAKSYLLDHQNTFSYEQWNILISDDYITIQELYEASPYWTIGYIKPLDTPEKRLFFKNFCEDRNWLFTETDIERLQSLFNHSWLPGIAFYEKSLGIPDMPVEELRELIDYACELFFRIPYICNLEHFIAGCITNPAVKNAIGTDICDSWYQLLLDRGYQTIEAVQKEYLSKEAYEEILRRKKQLEEEEKLRIEQESVKKQTTEWIEELQIMQKTVDKFILIKNHFPSLFYYGTRVQALACLELLKQVPDGGVLKEELVEPYYSFFVQCYVNELITKEQMLHYMKIFTK